jgi:hypothetical protein
LQGIGLIVDDVALEVEVVWKVRFSTLIMNQHKWASHYHNFVVWDFFKNWMVKKLKVSLILRCLKWYGACFAIMWHQVQAPITQVAQHIIEKA